MRSARWEIEPFSSRRADGLFCALLRSPARRRKLSHSGAGATLSAPGVRKLALFFSFSLSRSFDLSDRNRSERELRGESKWQEGLSAMPNILVSLYLSPALVRRQVCVSPSLEPWLFLFDFFSPSLLLTPVASLSLALM